MVTALYDFPTRRTTIPFPAITDNSSIPVWSSDSKTFIINNASPLGSNWEKRDIEEHRISGLDSNMFWVEPDSGKIEEVFANMPVDSDRPLYWRSDGSILLRVGATTVAEFVHIEGEWKEASRFEIPIKNLYRNTPLASNGAVIVGSYEASAIPPRLFIFERATGMVKSANLNPQLNHATLAPIDAVDWVTSDGMQVRGLLLKPVGYVQGTRYPLVIQTKGNNGSFLCDSGTDHDPAFSPQPIANNGMMYLIRTFPPTYNPEDEEARFSKEYPGRIGEAVYEMGIWESAIESLDKKGLIDPTKVGIMGFSRSGWQVEFDLAQSKVRYAAATAADNIQYSFGEYSLSSLRWDSSAEEDMYGGSPFGKSLAAWLAYSVSFNLPKFHTPLLMETNGYGVHDDAPGRIPFHIAFATEVFAGLNKLKKPVEWYYYPNEEHQPDHPRARLASLERNLDWYLFWLRDYEDPDPVKREQYDRWRHLRELQREDSLSRKK
jgi:dipeptidyl aminopeptidase/acylaminoacyl peptidase